MWYVDDEPTWVLLWLGRKDCFVKRNINSKNSSSREPKRRNLSRPNLVQSSQKEKSWGLLSSQQPWTQTDSIMRRIWWTLTWVLTKTSTWWMRLNGREWKESVRRDRRWRLFLKHHHQLSQRKIGRSSKMLRNAKRLKSRHRITVFRIPSGRRENSVRDSRGNMATRTPTKKTRIPARTSATSSGMKALSMIRWCAGVRPRRRS